jgi:hypothetical protein
MMTSRRARRKTVTFDERCDVVEFEREEHEDEGDDSRDVFFESDDDQDGLAEREWEERARLVCTLVSYTPYSHI